MAEAGDRSSGGGRSGVVFAYHLLRNHVVWRNPKLWDSIVAESCGGTSRTCVHRRPSPLFARSSMKMHLNFRRGHNLPSQGRRR